MAGAFRCRADAEWRTWERRFKAVWTAAKIMQDGPMLLFVRKCKAAVRAQIEVPEDLRRVRIAGE